MSRVSVVLVSFALAAACSPREEPEAPPVVTVKVAPVEQADLVLHVRAPALVHPRQQASIASRLVATIRELTVGKGDRVAAGAVLARLEQRDLLAQQAESRAALAQAEALEARRSRLYEEGAIPERDLLAARTELATARARLDLVEAQLHYTELTSPFAGTVTEQLLYPGDMARPDNPIFTVMDLAVVVARAQVPEGEAVTVRSGQPCAFAGAEAPGSSGRITVVGGAIDPARRTVEAWCEIQNPAGRLRPGSFGELSIETGTAPGSVVVPVAAVEFVEGTHRGTVRVVDEGKKALRREIESGAIVDGKVQVKSGLRPGETVIVEGGYGLPDGTAVRTGDGEAR
jgi:RND family efflux transporter MFP subunit